jgi:hypothetical protein
MARKRQTRNHASKRWLGLKVFVALMVGMTLAVLVTQYNTLANRVRRMNGHLGDDDATEKFEPVPQRAATATAAPAVEPEWEEAAPASESPSLQEQAAAEGEFYPEEAAHDCPPEYPIKGNSKSHIYHLPGGASYDVTMPNICFATEEAAEAAGYRATKR